MIGFSAAVLGGCGGDKKVDCEKLGAHVAEVSTKTVAPNLKDQLHKRIRTSTEEGCRSGAYPAEQADCLFKAASEADVARCVGRPPLGEPKAEPSAKGGAAPGAPATPPGASPESGAAPQFEASCAKGDASACGAAALVYFAGRGVPKDPVKGRALMEQACNSGYAVSCDHLAIRFAEGNDVPADPAASLAAATKGCELTDKHCAVLGNLHEKGIGVPRDAAKARSYFERACKAGNQHACKAIGG